MRLLLHDYAGHPFQVQLSRALAARGHEVLHLYCAQLQTPRGALALRADDPKSLRIEGVDLGEPIQKYDFVKRRGQEVRYGKLVAERIRAFRPDAVMASNTNLDSLRSMQGACDETGARFVYWLQDVLGVAAERILREKYGLPGVLVGKYYERMERTLLRKSAGIVAITEDFAPLLRGYGIPDTRIHVIPNWAPLEEMPTHARPTAWERAHGLEGKRVFLYSGTLGLKHNPESLVRLAERVQAREDVRVVVISEGLGAEHLARRKDELGLDNLVLLPYQPFDVLPQVLGTADVLLAILEPDAGIFSVPSKVLSYLCAGRPLLLAVPPENLAARTVVAAGAGRVVPPANEERFVAAAVELLENPRDSDDMGRRARAYAEATFDIGRIADRFEYVLGDRLSSSRDQPPAMV